MTWADLFERAAGFDVDGAAVIETLAARRDRLAGDANDRDDAS